jgi:hypothetical protein
MCLDGNYCGRGLGLGEVVAMMELQICQCPEHGCFAVSIDDTLAGCGTRVTPKKCCGHWRTLAAFKLSPREWSELAVQANTAAIEEAKSAAGK